MRNRKPKAKATTSQHRQTLFALLYLAGVILLFNAWLVTQHAPAIGN